MGLERARGGLVDFGDGEAAVDDGHALGARDAGPGPLELRDDGGVDLAIDLDEDHGAAVGRAGLLERPDEAGPNRAEDPRIELGRDGG